MIHFTFNGKSSREFGIHALSIDRTLLPEKKDDSYEIPGISGSYYPDDGDEPEYHDREISVQIAALTCKSNEELNKVREELAAWLSVQGYLIFEDEPTKAYVGRIYSAVNFIKYGSNDYLSDGFTAATADLVFKCKPFSESVELHHEYKSGSGQIALTVLNKGTQKTCGKIVIKNTGNQTIREIIIERKVVYK